ncbi:hypothetical protein LOK49_LG06G00742 [Camellia lanceoleosa]|uniref:Uncharacterized protein n=1 Tax=Camellia lanceoleosa TaxID=1840588 RepID=A0ACC0HGH6_9ERIC|nr:hypothetical protein LOK49_LG06G00742 [Camellia lanceoleosa]
MVVVAVMKKMRDRRKRGLEKREGHLGFEDWRSSVSVVVVPVVMVMKKIRHRGRDRLVLSIDLSLHFCRSPPPPLFGGHRCLTKPQLIPTGNDQQKLLQRDEQFRKSDRELKKAIMR